MESSVIGVNVGFFFLLSPSWAMTDHQSDGDCVTNILSAAVVLQMVDDVFISVAAPLFPALLTLLQVHLQPCRLLC